MFQHGSRSSFWPLVRTRLREQAYTGRDTELDDRMPEGSDTRLCRWRWSNRQGDNERLDGFRGIGLRHLRLVRSGQKSILLVKHARSSRKGRDKTQDSFLRSHSKQRVLKGF